MLRVLILAVTAFKTVSSIAAPDDIVPNVPVDIVTTLSAPPTTTLISIEQAPPSGSDTAVAPPSTSASSFATQSVPSFTESFESYVFTSTSIYLSTMVIPATPTPSFITVTRSSSTNEVQTSPLGPSTITDISTVTATDAISSPSAIVDQNLAVISPTPSMVIPTALDDTLSISLSQSSSASQLPASTLSDIQPLVTSTPVPAGSNDTLPTLVSQPSSTSPPQNSIPIYSAPLQNSISDSTPIPTALDDTLPTLSQFTSTSAPQSSTVLNVQTPLTSSPTPIALDNTVPSLPPDSPPPPSTLPTSPDGTCSEKTFSCYGSSFGECCSLADTCGSDETHCGEMKCKLGLGNCGSQYITAVNERRLRGRRDGRWKRGGMWRTRE